MVSDTGVTARGEAVENRGWRSGASVVHIGFPRLLEARRDPTHNSTHVSRPVGVLTGHFGRFLPKASEAPVADAGAPTLPQSGLAREMTPRSVVTAWLCAAERLFGKRSLPHFGPAMRPGRRPRSRSIREGGGAVFSSTRGPRIADDGGGRSFPQCLRKLCEIQIPCTWIAAAH